MNVSGGPIDIQQVTERERERGFYFISDTMYNNSLITFALNTNLLLLFSMAI